VTGADLTISPGTCVRCGCSALMHDGGPLRGGKLTWRVVDIFGEVQAGSMVACKEYLGLPPLTPELTLDDIDAHLKTLGLRSRASWRGGEWTVQLTARKEEHQKNVGRRAFGRAALIEEAFARALEEWEKAP
jgi:hypothetical protein